MNISAHTVESPRGERDNSGLKIMRLGWRRGIFLLTEHFSFSIFCNWNSFQPGFSFPFFLPMMNSIDTKKTMWRRGTIDVRCEGWNSVVQDKVTSSNLHFSHPTLSPTHSCKVREILLKLSSCRVAHRVLLRFERIVLLRSFKECNVLLLYILFSSFWRLIRPKRMMRSFAFFS